MAAHHRTRSGGSLGHDEVMGRTLAIFFRAPGPSPWTVIVCLLFASVAEGIGLASLLPLISLVASPETQSNSVAQRAVVGIIGRFGLSPTLGTLLVIIVGTVVLKA